jgi:hypothetical protein
MKRVIGVLTCLMSTVTALSAQANGEGVKITPVSDTAPAASSQDQEFNIQVYIQLLRRNINKTRSQIIGDVMQLYADQAVKFWPVYKDFQSDLDVIVDQMAALIKEYSDHYDDMTNERADKLATRLLDIGQQRNELKRRYYEKFKTALDPVIAAEFLQVENQIDNLLDLQIDSKLPIVDRPAK